MDCTGRKEAEEAFEDQDSGQNDFQNIEAHTRCSQTKGTSTRILNWSST
jgi:hypothetical protein